MHYDYIKVCTATPKLALADCTYNVDQIITCITEAISHQASLIVFPELSLTGYSCGDLFFQRTLLEASEAGVRRILEATCEKEQLIVVGAPIPHEGCLYNAALVLFKGKILGVVPKIYLPNYNEFYEKRWFSSGLDIECSEITYANQTTILSSYLIFKAKNIPYFSLGLEICEDLWATLAPSLFHTLYGATIVANLSASNENVGKADFRKTLVSQHSAKTLCAYLYSSCGIGESTTDVVFSGHNLIYENGHLLAESELFQVDNQLTYATIDLEHVYKDRMHQNSIKPMKLLKQMNYTYVTFDIEIPDVPIERAINPHPFIHKDEKVRTQRCKNIFEIQTHGLARRIAHTNAKTFVCGISGGLDSTLALLVCVKAAKLLEKPLSSIVGVTMPGFGTTDRTYQNAINLMKLIGVTQKEISIVPATTLHLEQIGHDMMTHDITYENAQARERTKILMNLANKYKGLVIGTGDLSELALGWATYNGDHMSMYAVNSSVPKTLVRYLIEYVAYYESEPLVQEILFDILETPVSPELLPPNKEGEISQKTEDLVGPYELHDFYLYQMLRFGYTPTKIYALAQVAFKGSYNNDIILKWLKVFYKRFFSQQFKRSCLPDGPKVGSICLSPRGDWRMPSDANSRLWLEELEKIKP